MSTKENNKKQKPTYKTDFKYLRLKPAIHQELKVAASIAGVKFSDYVARLLSNRFTGDGKSGTGIYASENLIAHNQLEFVLKNGSENDKIGILANLEWATKAVTGRLGTTPT